MSDWNDSFLEMTEKEQSRSHMENFIDLRSPAYPKDPFGKCRGYMIGFHTTSKGWAIDKVNNFHVAHLLPGRTLLFSKPLCMILPNLI